MMVLLKADFTNIKCLISFFLSFFPQNLTFIFCFFFFNVVQRIESIASPVLGKSSTTKLQPQFIISCSLITVENRTVIPLISMSLPFVFCSFEKTHVGDNSLEFFLLKRKFQQKIPLGGIFRAIHHGNLILYIFWESKIKSHRIRLWNCS